MRIIRVLAQLVDLFTGFAALVVSYLAVPPVLSQWGFGPVVSGTAVFIVFILLAVLVQIPFLRDGQTIGKAFFGLVIVSEDTGKPPAISVLLQREIFCKLATCYFICLPVLLGQSGGHETATKTRIIKGVRKE